ncbi:MAG: alpha/beta fold hydrolase [Hyphomonadaceae bacterium]|nr:alpha/beta fold hydrolase [Hyphomonadaceae bacterium]
MAPPERALMLRGLVRLAALGCALALATACAGQGGAHPLALEKMGYLYVGGDSIERDGGRMYVDAMFTEYFIPAHCTQPYPIVLVHGGTSTGATYLGTPDDRQGWAEFFLRHGYAVYVIDQPTRGRSAYDPATDGPLLRAREASTLQMFTAPAKFNLWPQARLHTQFPGTGEPGDPAYENFRMAQQGSIDGGVRMDTINRDALTALLDRIGPAIILTHSRAGPFGWLAADARPGLVKGIIAVEPNGPPFHHPEGPMSANRPPGAAERPWGITYERMTFAPTVNDPAELAPVQQPSQGPDLQGCWVASGPARTLPNLVGVPIMIISSEAGFHAQYTQCMSQFLTQFGVANELVRLEEHGLPGNGHLLLIEKNNLEIAALIDAWLRRNVH